MSVNVSVDPLSSPWIGELAAETSDLIVDLTGQVQGGFSPLDLAHDRLNSKALSILGISSCLNLVMGPIRVLHGVKEINLSQTLKDYWGEVHGYLKAFQGGVQTIAGAVFVPASALIVALFFTASQVMTVVSKILTAIGGGFLALGSFFQLIGSAVKFSHALQLRRMIEKSLEQNGAVQTLSDLKTKILTERAHFERVLDSELVEEVIKASSEKAQATLDRVLSLSAKEMALQAFCLFLCVSAIALTLIAFFFTGPVAPILLGAMGTVLGLMFLVIDLRNVAQEMKGPIGKYDALWVYLSAAFSALLVIPSFVIASNPYVLSIIALSAFLLLIVHLACMIRIHTA